MKLNSDRGFFIFGDPNMRLKNYIIDEAKKKLGDCYEVAGNYAMLHRDDKDTFVVHGEVSGQGVLAGINYDHAWIEKGEDVIDDSNGRHIVIPKVLYYAIGHIHKVKKYTPKEALSKMLKTGHYGDWK